MPSTDDETIPSAELSDFDPVPAPTSVDRAIGILLSAVDNLTAALQATDPAHRVVYVEEARRLVAASDLIGWQRAGAVYPNNPQA